MERSRIRSHEGSRGQLHHNLQHGKHGPDGHPYWRQHRRRSLPDTHEPRVQFAKRNSAESHTNPRHSRRVQHPVRAGSKERRVQGNRGQFETFQKFRKVSKGIGTQMKSVGEVMAIGRCFEEALQKAIRMLDIGKELTDNGIAGRSIERIRKELREPTDERIFYVTKALKSGISMDEIARLSGIDRWFLDKINNILEMEKRIAKERINPGSVRRAKQFGFSDKKLGKLLGKTEAQIRDYRKDHDILPVTKQIDTMAAEWPAATNYLYLTYGGEVDDVG